MNLPYSQVWVVDFEYTARDGYRPVPVCMVARELRSNHLIRIWQDTLHEMKGPPFPVSDQILFVAYSASAELGCFKALNWPLPCNILDLHVEFRAFRKGLDTPRGFTLLDVLKHYCIPGITSEMKTSMRELILKGAPWSAEEQRAILDFCQAEVDVMVPLLAATTSEKEFDLAYAVYRGLYMRAVTVMEWTGAPIDCVYYSRFKEEWEAIKLTVIKETASKTGIYEGTTFKAAAFEEWVFREGLEQYWPRLPTGCLATDDDTFREMSKSFKQVQPIRVTRQMVGTLRDLKLVVGPDGRNRCSIFPFSSLTGRNQPSTTKFIFGLPAFLRSLIRPEPGTALAYIDYSQQELGTAAALSSDEAMRKAYAGGDFYMAAAIEAGLAPAGATKMSHPEIREQFKIVCLGVMYGMNEYGVARKIGSIPARGRELLEAHRKAFSKFWNWREDVIDTALARLRYTTVFNWPIHISQSTKLRTISNFPMQANGAEMMRLAACLMTESGIKVCAPVHDAFLIEGPAAEIDDIARTAQEFMHKAGRIVLNGFELRSDVKIVRSQDRYFDERGKEMWKRVCELAGLDPQIPKETL